MLKWLRRVLIGLLVVLVLGGAGAFLSFSAWKAERTRALAAESIILETSRGPVEYLAAGEGTPILLLHGTPGGYDQSLAGRRANPAGHSDSMEVVVSRPGYLRTPLSSGPTFEAQADLMAALLDELGVEQAVVYAASGGGYVGLQFALRHPERCRALILYAPSMSYEPLRENESQSSNAVILELVAWVASGPLSTGVVSTLIDGIDAGDPKQIAFGREMLLSLAAMDLRAPGRRNDIVQRNDPAIDAWPLERITAPTLILHGDADENSAYAASVAAARRIPNAELVTFPGGDHFIAVTKAAEIGAEVRRFLASLPPASNAAAGQISAPPSH